jgi:subtilisin family serine protease
MNRKSVLTIAFLITLITLKVGINLPSAQGANVTGSFKGKKVYGSDSLKNSSKGTNQGAAKVKFIDKGDFYFINTGEKKSFLIEENAHFIIYKHKAFPSLTQDVLQNLFIEDLDIISEHRLKKLVKLKIKKGKKQKDIISELYRAEPSIYFISPALTTKDKGGELAVLPNIIVRIDESVATDYAVAELNKHGLSFLSKLPLTDSAFEMKINGPVDDISRIFEITRTVAQLPFVKWAEPNLIVNMEKRFTPDDTLFNNQWHLNNTGQNGAAVDADIDAPEGWDFAQGNGAVIAILDDGVDTSHEDLNIWSNPGETGDGKETNGIDDDGNGYIDDYQGWDFGDNDNNPDPGTSSDNHGTSVAGVAGAAGNNSLGVTGSSPGAVILPVRSGSMLCTEWGNAMRYAAKHADLVSNSWTISGCESNLNAAISDAVNGSIAGARRGTKGSPVLFASGNNASGWRKYTLTGFPAGTYSFQWKYSKDRSVDSGYDTVWLDDITWPGGSATDFESDTAGNVPGGFTSGGDANWTVVNDGIHARGASGNSVKAGTISRRDETYLDITKAVGAGTLTFWVWVSSEQYYDLFEFFVDGTRYFYYAPGQYGHENSVGYPASNSDTIAVGASNDGGISGEEERSDYSQFGSELDVVAPSSGGGQGITTTDRMGADGYDASNYTSTFGGTSSATPLVAGIAAVIIADNPALTAAEVRTILREGADEIGPYAYSGNRNDFYGYGRVNLFNSLCPDSDGDGYTTCANDCDDGNPAINPSASEVCDNKDNNCDGSIDESLTRATTCGVGECGSSGIETCTSGIWGGDTCMPGTPATEVCDNLDNNCEGSIDESLTRATTCGVGECGSSGIETCTAGIWGGDTCTPGTPGVETCDNLDNNCDGSIDEDLQYQLTTPVDPKGAGFVTPDCSEGCTYDCLDSVILMASEYSGYFFDSWTNCDSASNNICTETIDEDDNVTANFQPCYQPVRIVAAVPLYFDTLQAAYDEAIDGDIIQVRDEVFDDNVSAGRSISVTFAGGYNCNYSGVIGVTTFNGIMNVSDGTVIIGDFIFGN